MAGLPVPNDNVPYLEPLFVQTDLTAQLPNIQCPVLVLYGERDAVMVVGGRILASGLPQASVVSLSRVGHEPFIEDPDRAFLAIREFLFEDD